MTAFLLLSALVGATLVLVRSTLFRPVQRLYPPLFGCAQCAGFWVGALGGAAGLASVGRGRVVDALACGFATSLLSLLADAVLLNLLGDPNEEKVS